MRLKGRPHTTITNFLTLSNGHYVKSVRVGKTIGGYLSSNNFVTHEFPLSLTNNSNNNYVHYNFINYENSFINWKRTFFPDINCMFPGSDPIVMADSDLWRNLKLGMFGKQIKYAYAKNSFQCPTV